jgi:hypothetical protein
MLCRVSFLEPEQPISPPCLPYGLLPLSWQPHCALPFWRHPHQQRQALALQHLLPLLAS